ncbi:MAG: hypothetical protein ACETVR_03625 [Candidatus Bathyarchaeia archaeon]
MNQKDIEKEEKLIQKGWAEKILAKIPCDRWVSAKEIADKLGISSRKVGAIISYKLLYHSPIERKKMYGKEGDAYLYRRTVA